LTIKHSTWASFKISLALSSERHASRFSVHSIIFYTMQRLLGTEEEMGNMITTNNREDRGGRMVHNTTVI
jgi:prephenate dehydrogenase